VGRPAYETALGHVITIDTDAFTRITASDIRDTEAGR
jgi:hypothetical protein